MFEVLDDSNFSMYAVKQYDNPSCLGEEEFREDMGRFRNLSRMFGKYSRSGELRDRMIMNHLVVIYNVFPREAATRMLVFRLHGYLEYLRPFLEIMGYWPERVESIGYIGNTVDTSRVMPDKKIVDTLEQI